MIIATIGSDQFALASLEDAHQLLQILDRAKGVDDGYVDKDYDRRYYLTTGSRREVAIKVVGGELLTQEQFNELRRTNGVTL